MALLGGIIGCKDKTILYKSRWPYYCILLLTYLIMYHNVFVFVWCPCMEINVQHNGGFLPGIILLTQCYYHRGTRLNAMKRFCICSL